MLVSMICLVLSALLRTGQWLYLVQKLAVSLREKGLNSDTGIAASDEADYGQSIEMFLQYGDSLSVIDQINTHSYPGVLQSCVWQLFMHLWPWASPCCCCDHA